MRDKVVYLRVGLAGDFCRLQLKIANIAEQRDEVFGYQPTLAGRMLFDIPPLQTRCKSVTAYSLFGCRIATGGWGSKKCYALNFEMRSIVNICGVSE